VSEKTIYEQDHPARRANSSAIAFGRITAVDPVARLCTVKTFFATHPSVNDLHIPACQWLNMDCNPAGDETTSVPRAGSIGMVIFVQGEPFIFGYFKGLNAQGQAVTGEEVTNLTEGDKVISTVGGNYITIKASGAIIIQSKQTLRTLYFPTGSLLSDLCRNYEMYGDGGFVTWKSNLDDNTVLFSATYRQNLANTAQVLEQNGTVDGTTIRQIAIGPSTDSGIFVYEQTIDVDGTVVTNVGPPGVVAYTSTINPDGSFSVANGAGQALNCAVDATGAANIAFGPLVSLSIKTTGDISLMTPGAQLSISASGDVQLKALGSASLQFGDDVEIDIFGDCKILSFGAITLSGSTGIKLDGLGASGAGAMFGVLTFPNVIDPLTGTPLGPGSTTVMASI